MVKNEFRSKLELTTMKKSSRRSRPKDKRKSLREKLRDEGIIVPDDASQEIERTAYQIGVPERDMSDFAKQQFSQRPR